MLFMTDVLTQVRRAIRTSGVSRYAISKATGIAQSQLSRLMHGENGLSIDSLERLLAFLELEIVIRPISRSRRKE